jgi:hypothetical protein
MENDYESMTDTELADCLKRVQEKLEDTEDELSLRLGQSQSGQHMSSEYVQSHSTRIKQEMESLTDTIEKIQAEIENRKKT